MKLLRQLLNSWKVGKSSELKLNCENGVMKVTMTADLGEWVQHQSSESGDMGYQGSRRRASPSYLRRQERRAAARAADSLPVVKEASAEEAAAAKPSSRTCTKCGQPCRGHAGPTGLKCSNAQLTTSTPEKIRNTSLSASLQLTPVKEIRVEECSNCEELMTLTHQCEEAENAYDEEPPINIKNDTLEEDTEEIKCVRMCPRVHKPERKWCYEECDGNKCWCHDDCVTPCDLSVTCYCEYCAPFTSKTPNKKSLK